MPIIQSLERALHILDLFQDNQTELKITEISAKLDLHKSTVHSLLKTLQLYQYIEQNPQNGQYRLGMKLVERGQFVLDSLDLRSAASPMLQQLTERTGQTSHLVILEGKEGVYIDKVEGAQAVIRYSRIGRRIPLHCSAVGKVLLAYQPAAKQDHILQQYAYEVHTDRTLRNEEQFRRELALVQERRYAVDNEENEPGVRCVAAPVLDVSGSVIASVSVSTLISRVDDEQLEQIIPQLLHTCKEISVRLGYRGSA